MASIFRKTKVKLDLLSDIDMSLMVEKGNRVEYVMLVIDMRKLIKIILRNKEIWKIIIKIKNRHNFSIGA